MTERKHSWDIRFACWLSTRGTRWAAFVHYYGLCKGLWPLKRLWWYYLAPPLEKLWDHLVWPFRPKCPEHPEMVLKQGSCMRCFLEELERVIRKARLQGPRDDHP